MSKRNNEPGKDGEWVKMNVRAKTPEKKLFEKIENKTAHLGRIRNDLNILTDAFNLNQMEENNLIVSKVDLYEDLYFRLVNTINTLIMATSKNKRLKNVNSSLTREFFMFAVAEGIGANEILAPYYDKFKGKDISFFKTLKYDDVKGQMDFYEYVEALTIISLFNKVLLNVSLCELYAVDLLVKRLSAYYGYPRHIEDMMDFMDTLLLFSHSSKNIETFIQFIVESPERSENFLTALYEYKADVISVGGYTIPVSVAGTTKPEYYDIVGYYLNEYVRNFNKNLIFKWVGLLFNYDYIINQFKDIDSTDDFVRSEFTPHDGRGKRELYEHYEFNITQAAKFQYFKHADLEYRKYDSSLPSINNMRGYFEESEKKTKS